MFQFSPRDLKELQWKSRLTEVNDNAGNCKRIFLSALVDFVSFNLENRYRSHFPLLIDSFFLILSLSLHSLVARANFHFNFLFFSGDYFVLHVIANGFDHRLAN